MPGHHLTCTAARPAVATAFDPRWRTETAVLLARGVVADEAFDRLPILADALEEAGCDDPTTLRHCRECRHHTTFCWVLADLLDLPVTLEPARMTDAEVRREVEAITGRPVLAPDPHWRPRRRLLWRVLVILAAVAALAVVWAGFPATGSTPYTNTYHAPAVGGTR